MTNPNTLFFVGAKSVDNDSFDLLVVAPNKDDPETIWLKHYELEKGEANLQFINPVPGVVPNREPGAIGWDEINPD